MKTECNSARSDVGFSDTMTSQDLEEIPVQLWTIDTCTSSELNVNVCTVLCLMSF